MDKELIEKIAGAIRNVDKRAYFITAGAIVADVRSHDARTAARSDPVEPPFVLVEKTARAIFEAGDHDREWSDYPQDHLKYRDQARAAIRTMRSGDHA